MAEWSLIPTSTTYEDLTILLEESRKTSRRVELLWVILVGEAMGWSKSQDLMKLNNRIGWGWFESSRLMFRSPQTMVDHV